MTLLKLNVTAFGGNVSQPLILKMKYFTWPLDLGNGEGEKSLSSYNREPRVVCKTSRRKTFSKSEHFGWVNFQRERVSCIFLKWAQIPRRFFFEVGTNPKTFPFSWDVLYCTILAGHAF